LHIKNSICLSVACVGSYGISANEFLVSPLRFSRVLRLELANLWSGVLFSGYYFGTRKNSNGKPLH